MQKNGQNSSGIQITTAKRHRPASGVNLFFKGKQSEALWATELYQRLGPANNIHIRRLHYHALSLDNLSLPTGKPYRNTLSDYKYLKNAFDQARLMGFVPYNVFSENREFSDFPKPLRKGSSAADMNLRQLLKQMIEQTCRRYVKSILSDIVPVHVEIWLEQTTAADIITPLAGKYHLNIVASHENISLTKIWCFIRRVCNISKPVRIIYISDYYPHTFSLPAYDKLKLMLNQYGLSNSLDLKIIKLALDRRECRKYDLPCAPALENGKSNPTELHSLEVAAPGYLCRNLEKHVGQYFNYKLLRKAENNINKSVDRLLLHLNCEIDKKPDLYEIYEDIRRAFPRN